MAAADTAAQPFDSGHLDQVHDAQMDYYGKRIATCSSDRTIKVFDIINSQPSPSVSTLQIKKRRLAVFASAAGPADTDSSCFVSTGRSFGPRRACVASDLGASKVWQPFSFMLL